MFKSVLQLSFLHLQFTFLIILCIHTSGGTIGLFTGMSLVSLVEASFWTLKLCNRLLSVVAEEEEKEMEEGEAVQEVKVEES